MNQVNKIHKQLVNTARRSYYEYKIFSPQVPVENDTKLNLYNIDTFDDFSVQSSSLNSKAFGKYFGLLPFQLECQLLSHYKHYVVSLDLYPSSNLLKLTCLSLNGKYQKFIQVSNIIPVPYSDYRESCGRVLCEPPQFIDWQMIYFNPMAREFYVFDQEGKWDEKNIQHELLQVSALYDERKWLDSLRLM